MKQFSFIFAGTSELALNCLKLLLEMPFLDLKGIVSRPDTLKGRGMRKQSSLVKNFALEKGYPVWTPHRASSADFLNDIARKKCDFSFVCSYGQILPLAYLHLFSKGSLNLHLSLLPRWRGAAPVQRALMAGDQKTGVCLQIMTESLDAGDVIGQRSFQIKEKDNAKDIFDQALIEIEFLLKEKLLKYLRGELKAYPQDTSQITYARKIDKASAQILWKDSALKIHNKIRALFLGPQAFCFFKGKRVKIYRAEIVLEDCSNFTPGEVCLLKKNKLFVVCGDGALSFLEVQKEGKRRQEIEDFLRGQNIKLRDKFV